MAHRTFNRDPVLSRRTPYLRLKAKPTNGWLDTRDAELQSVPLLRRQPAPCLHRRLFRFAGIRATHNEDRVVATLPRVTVHVDSVRNQDRANSSVILSQALQLTGDAYPEAGRTSRVSLRHPSETPHGRTSQ